MNQTPSQPITLVDYVLSHGQQSLVELPFNEVDSLVISKLTNADFWDYAGGQSDFTIKISDLASIKPYDELCAKMWNTTEGIRLLEAAASSKRYGELLMHDFKMVVSNKQQFMALTVDLGIDSAPCQYLSFRGTDESFGGWREDMEITYRRDLPSWNQALLYTRQIADKYPGQLILGGHSKGGNLAIYAGLKSSKNIQRRVIAIYNHDGPGFLPGTFANDEYDAMASKIHKSIPETSIIGLIMENQIDQCNIVQNRAKFINQHDQLNWLVNGTEFAYVDNISDLARHCRNIIAKWIQRLEPGDRQRFINNLFRMLETTGTNNFVALSRHVKQSPRQAHQQIRRVDRHERRVVWRTFRLLIWLSLTEYLRHVKGKSSQIVHRRK